MLIEFAKFNNQFGLQGEIYAGSSKKNYNEGDFLTSLPYGVSMPQISSWIKQCDSDH